MENLNTTMILFAIGGIALVLLILWACCVAGGRADDSSKAMYKAKYGDDFYD